MNVYAVSADAAVQRATAAVSTLEVHVAHVYISQKDTKLKYRISNTMSQRTWESYYGHAEPSSGMTRPKFYYQRGAE